MIAIKKGYEEKGTDIMIEIIKHIFFRKYWILCLLCLFLLVACSQSPTTSPVQSATPTTAKSTGTPSTTSTGTTGTSTTGQNTSTPSTTSIPAEPLKAIRFVDSLHGWALTKDRVLRTQDGGKTWINVTAPGFTSSTLRFNNEQAVFQTADRAWVLLATPINGNQQGGGVTIHVWFTSNGGSNWTQTTFNDSRSLGFADRPTFISATLGWVLLDTGAGAGSYGVDLYQTKDGGATWQLISAAPGNIPLSGSKTGPSFADANTGWIADFVGALSNAALLDKSTDGGVTWTAEHLPLISAYQNALYQTTPPVIFGSTLIEPVHVIVGTQHYLVTYRSNDGGAHWSTATPANFDTDNVYVIDYQGDAVAIANGTVYHSDAKGNWSQIGTIPSTAGPMSFINAQEGWSLDTNSAILYHTTNGGSSWQTINYSFVSNN